MLDRADIVTLSLPFPKDGLPFDLAGREKDFGPEDWAWQFLRMNDTYRADYELVEVQGRKVGSQARLKGYGLEMWIDPNCEVLPDKSFGASWFQPLIEPVEATEWDADAYPDEIPAQSPELSFQAGQLPDNRSSAGGCVSTAVWYAIDCSFRTAGQLEYVARSAKYYREWFKEEGLTRHSGSESTCVVLPLDQCKYFDANGFKSADGAIDKEVDPTLFWRAIRIDVFGPIAEQIEKCRKTLDGVYQDFREKNLVEAPFRERFRINLPGLLKEYGEHSSDGFFLKGAVIVEQLRRARLSDEGIAQYISENSSYKSWNAGSALNWAGDLEQRIPTYRRHAKGYVDGGYRWLIRSQNPEKPKTQKQER